MFRKEIPRTAAEWRAIQNGGRVAVSAMQQDQAQKQDRHNRGKSFKRPDLNNQYFRSQWEANYARYMNFLIERGMNGLNTTGLCHWVYEPIEFDFPIKRGCNTYKPDFLVLYEDGTHTWIEIKGWMDQKSKTKLKRFAKYYPEEEAVLTVITAHDMRYIRNQFSLIIPNWED